MRRTAERLRKKGFLNRRLVDGVYRYQARASSAELTSGAIRRFVEKYLTLVTTAFVVILVGGFIVATKFL